MRSEDDDQGQHALLQGELVDLEALRNVDSQSTVDLASTPDQQKMDSYDDTPRFDLLSPEHSCRDDKIVVCNIANVKHCNNQAEQAYHLGKAPKKTYYGNGEPPVPANGWGDLEEDQLKLVGLELPWGKVTAAGEVQYNGMEPSLRGTKTDRYEEEDCVPVDQLTEQLGSIDMISWTRNPTKLFRDHFPTGFPKEWVKGVIDECFSEGVAQIRANGAWIACPNEDDLTREDVVGYQLIVNTRKAKYFFLAYSISKEERVLERDGRIILPDGDTESNSKQWGAKYDELVSHSPDSKLLTNKKLFCTYLRDTYLFTANTDKPNTCVYSEWFEVKTNSFRQNSSGHNMPLKVTAVVGNDHYSLYHAQLAEKRKARANEWTKPSTSSVSFGSPAPGKPVPNHQTAVRCLLTHWCFDCTLSHCACTFHRSLLLRSVQSSTKC
jgi:hypothetical protein